MPQPSRVLQANNKVAVSSASVELHILRTGTIRAVPRRMLDRLPTDVTIMLEQVADQTLAGLYPQVL
ncbi:hypothetical protein D3C84_1004870 [compost metagenome]